MDSQSKDAKELYWREQLSRYGAQAASGEAFCRLHGLSYCQFAYWRKKLGAANAVRACVVRATSFVPVAIAPSNVARDSTLPDARWCAEFIAELMRRSGS